MNTQKLLFTQKEYKILTYLLITELARLKDCYARDV